MIKGLEKLDSLISRLQSLPEVVSNMIRETITAEADKLIAYARHYIEDLGERADGKNLQPRGYSDAYAAYKKQFARHKNTEFVDLKAEGDFLGGLTLTYRGNLTWEFESTDEKYEELALRYGKMHAGPNNPLLGIREEDLEDFTESILKPAIVQAIKSHLTQ